MKQTNVPSVINYNLKKVTTYDGYIFFVDDELNIYSKQMHLLKPRIDKRGGYLTVSVYSPKQTAKYVHRIIAQAFIKPDLNDEYEVHHKDRDRTNNSIENLEVMLRYDHKLEHNLKYPEQKQCDVCGEWFTPNITKRKRAHVCSEECWKIHHDNMVKEKLRRSIDQFDETTGELIKTWEYGMLIEQETGYSLSNIVNCCRGKLKHTYGYVWRYHDEN